MSSSARTITTKGGEVLYVHVPDSSDKEIEELYKCEEELSEALGGYKGGSSSSPNLESQYKTTFQKILASVSPNHSKKAKELACQFIPKYAAHFPSLSTEILNSQLDLCEDEDRGLRIQAIKALPKLCQLWNSQVHIITSVLIQLLRDADAGETQIVKDCLNELMDLDAKTCFASALQQIASPSSGDEAMLREKAIDYLSDIMKKKNINLQFQDEKVQEQFLKDAEKILSIFTSSSESFLNHEKEAENMRLFLSLISKLKMFKNDTVAWMKFLKNHCPVDVESSLHLKDDADKWKLRKFLSFLRAAKKGMTEQKENSPYFPFLMKHVFPNLKDLQNTNVEDDKLRVVTLRTIAEIAHCTSEYYSRTFIPTIYDALKSEIPEKADASAVLNFTNIECYLLIFHRLAIKSPGSLNAVCGIKIVTGQPSDTFGDYKHLRQEMIQKLHVLEQVCSPYVGRLKSLIDQLKKEGKEKNAEEVRTKTQIFKCIENIVTLTKALKKSRPEFIQFYDLIPSWIVMRKKLKKHKRKFSKEVDGNDKQGKKKKVKREHNEGSSKASSSYNNQQKRGNNITRGKGQRNKRGKHTK
ncbi:hypothetical protein C9374_012365 [Naegleria lovaniensis]|uniref:Uncharacterized protein n=1 Tax=Naegleria lovaniensis TaxID=51637 RepID=A0AA88G803_NAELO|nr:uncharacterized protein C9374_012365 [Naegleria lovaniensis]KAG2373262.1 hypothetical protein C9374_012365 [Naegleria lovaniensis]